MFDHNALTFTLGGVTAVVSLTLLLASRHYGRVNSAAFMAGARDSWVHAALMSNLCRDVGAAVLVLGTLVTLGVGLFY
jgi:hypothetical protein